jgi:hypothetical protein
MSMPLSITRDVLQVELAVPVDPFSTVQSSRRSIDCLLEAEQCRHPQCITMLAPVYLNPPLSKYKRALIRQLEQRQPYLD